MSGFLETQIGAAICEENKAYHRLIEEAQIISLLLIFYWIGCNNNFGMGEPSNTRGTNRRGSNSFSLPSATRSSSHLPSATRGRTRYQETPEAQTLISDILRRVRNTQHKGLTKRLASFVVFPQNTSFSRVELAKLGYIFSLNRIECSQCGFKTKTVFTEIVFYHKKFKNSCEVVRLHMQSVASNDGTDWPMSDEQYALKEESHFSTRLENESDKIASKVELESSKWRYEFERLNSFAEQKMEHFQILAKSGFYLPEKEKVQCYACGFSIIPTAWQTVFELHSVKSTGCPFLNGKASNVPLEQQSEPKILSIGDATMSATRGRDSDEEEGTSDEPQQRILDDGFFSRLITYRTWHDMDSKGVSAINCAYAGFEFDDRYSKPVLKCSDCPVIMLNTMPAVDMMVEHASCSPVCKFVARVKGADYFKYAIEIRNIALKKAGKPALNVKATDVKTALRTESKQKTMIAYLTAQQLDSFEKWTTPIVSLGFPPKLVHSTAVKILQDHPSLSDKERSITQLLKKVQQSYTRKYAQNADLENGVIPRYGSSGGSSSPTGSNSSDDSQQGTTEEDSRDPSRPKPPNWPPSLQLEETLGRCLQCLEEAISAQAVDCGHWCLCSHCASFVVRCPQCAGNITATIRTFVVESGARSDTTLRDLTRRMYDDIH